ncbi:hypothetical protein C2W62_02155 [Candidatus Entotheonella serta]|nr:hypothetical protein C2W62_02155 [Candidatus Entotheonella serta]
MADQNLERFELNYLSVVYPFQFLRRNITLSLNFQCLYNMEGNSDLATLLNPDGCVCTAVQRVRSRQTGQLFTLSPAMAVQITPAFAVGLAVNIWPNLFGNGWNQDVEVTSEGTISSGNRIVPFTSFGKIKETFAFEGMNFTLGFFWNLNSIFTVGGVVRTPFTAKVSRKHQSELTLRLQDGSQPAVAADRFTETLDMDFPLSYGLGVAAILTDSLTLALDVSRVHWSDFKLESFRQARTISVENTIASGKGEGVLSGRGDDITSVRLGAEYQWILPRIAVPFRASVFYDPEPGDEGKDDFFGFSLGATDGQTVSFWEIESVADPTERQQQSRVFRSVWQVAQHVAEDIVTFNISRMQRGGPLVRILTQGQLLPERQVRVTVDGQPGRFDVVQAEVRPAVSAPWQPLRAVGSRFEGLLSLPPRTPAPAVEVRVTASTGERLIVPHRYRMGNPSVGVVQRIASTGTTRFSSVAIAPDGTVWAGGNQGGRLYRVSPGDRQAEFVGNLLPAPMGRVESLVFDSQTPSRLHAVVFARLASGVITIEYEEEPRFCQTINVFEQGENTASPMPRQRVSSLCQGIIRAARPAMNCLFL